MLPLLILNLSFSCNKAENPDNSKSNSKKSNQSFYAVVRAMGNTKIIHVDKTEEKGNVGSFLVEGDRLTTESNGMVDLQLSDDTMLRVLPSSVVLITSIQNEKGKNSVSLLDGTIYCKVFSGKQDTKFFLNTPALVSTGGGSEFIVTHENDVSKVKVKFGQVVVYPRIMSLEDKDPLEIKEDEPNGKIARVVSEKTTLLESLKEISFSKNPDFQKTYADIDNKPQFVQQISNMVFQSKPTSLSSSEVESFNTISLQEENLILELYSISKELASGEKDPKKIMDLESRRSSIENQLLKSNYSTKELENKSFKEFATSKSSYTYSNYKKRYYRKYSYKRLAYARKKRYPRKLISYNESRDPNLERVEKLILKDERTEVGTIISQDADVIILLTDEGVKRIPASDLKEVTFDYIRKKRH